MEEVIIELKEIVDALSNPSITDWMMLVVTIVYVAATIIICISNYKSASAAKKQLEEAKNQLEESKKNQKQNAGIQLYELRKVALTGVIAENTELEADIELLFDNSILNAYKELCQWIRKYRIDCNDLEMFEKHIKDISAEEYEEYMRLQALSEQYSDYRKINEFASKYDFYTDTGIAGERKAYYYLDIIENILDSSSHKIIAYGELISHIKEFIKNSISEMH